MHTRTTRLDLPFKGLWIGILCACVIAVPSFAEEAAPTPAPTLNVGGVDQPGATIKGVVKFSGRQAKRKPIRMSADKYCESVHSAENPPLSEQYVFGDNDTLQNVFVWISKGLEGKTFTPPATKVVMDQHGCTYVPHVVGVMVNQEFDIHNSDNTLHNVKVITNHNGSFNEGMPVKDMVLAKKFTKPEMAMPFKCDVHPWMTAYVHVMEHPFFAVTQQDGTFTILGLPPGEYEVSVWHEFDKFTPDHAKVTVTLAEGQTKEVTFTYTPPN